MFERYLSRGLFFRLAILMSFALLPLGLIALYQTYTVVDEAARLSRVAILARTERAAIGERELLQRSQGAANTLASIGGTLMRERGACAEVMRGFVSDHPEYSFAGLTDADGNLICASDNTGKDVSEEAFFIKASNKGAPVFSVDRSLADRERLQLSLTYPIRDGDAVVGFATLGIPKSLTSVFFTEKWQLEGIKFATIDADGDILSSSDVFPQAGLLLPASIERDKLLGYSGQTFFAQSTAGNDRFFAISEVIPGQVAVVGSWPADISDLASGPGRWLLTLAFPVLMWVAGIGVAVFGLHQLVIRHLSDLRTAMRRYALGEREHAQLQLINPPREFSEAQQSFNRMVMILSNAESRREIDLQEKTVLLREVHHRVKNNLQLIASIMNMQARGTKSEEVRGVLSQLQRRVRGLAAIHRSLNTNPDSTAVDSRELIETLVGEARLQSGAAAEIRTEVQPVPLDQDTAVNLSMLLAEALSNAIKFASLCPEGQRTVDVQFFLLDDDRCHLVIRNSRTAGAGDDAADTAGSAGLGARLMKAFASQLGGEQNIRTTETTFTYDIVFSLDTP